MKKLLSVAFLMLLVALLGGCTPPRENNNLIEYQVSVCDNIPCGIILHTRRKNSPQFRNNLMQLSGQHSDTECTIPGVAPLADKLSGVAGVTTVYVYPFEIDIQMESGYNPVSKIPEFVKILEEDFGTPIKLTKFTRYRDDCEVWEGLVQGFCTGSSFRLVQWGDADWKIKIGQFPGVELAEMNGETFLIRKGTLFEWREMKELQEFLYNTPQKNN